MKHQHRQLCEGRNHVAEVATPKDCAFVKRQERERNEQQDVAAVNEETIPDLESGHGRQRSHIQWKQPLGHDHVKRNLQGAQMVADAGQLEIYKL